MGMYIRSDNRSVVGVHIDRKHRHAGNHGTWFSPLGLVDVASCILKMEDRYVQELEHFLQQAIPSLPHDQRIIRKLTFYHPDLSYGHDHTRKRDERCLSAAAALAGGPLASGAYESLRCRAVHNAQLLDTAMRMISDSGTCLRVEAIILDAVALSSDEVRSFKRTLVQFLRRQRFIRTVPIDDVDLARSVARPLHLLRSLSYKRVPQILGAEAYLQFLVDGGGNRFCSRSLKFVFQDMTVGQRRQIAIQAQDRMMRPAVENGSMANISVEMVLEKHQIIYDIGFHLNVPPPIVKSLLEHIERHFMGQRNLELNEEAWRWIDVVQRLELIYAGNDSMDMFSKEYHVRARTAYGYITWDDLARCLLHPRDKRGIRDLQRSILNAFLERRFPGMADDQKISRLSGFLRSKLVNPTRAWMHSKPLECRERPGRFWVVGDIRTDERIKRALTWWGRHCPMSV